MEAGRREHGGHGHSHSHGLANLVALLRHAHSHSHSHSRPAAQSRQYTNQVDNNSNNNSDNNNNDDDNHNDGDAARIPTAATIRSVFALMDGTEKAMFAVGMICLIISTGINVSLPYLMGLVIDSSTQQEVQQRGFMSAFILAIGASLTFLRSLLLTMTGERLSQRTRERIFAHYVGRPLAFFDSNDVGDLISRLSSDVNEFKQGFVLHLPFLVKFIVQALFGFIILFVIEWRLTLLLIAPLPVAAGIIAVMSSSVKHVSNRLQDDLGRAVNVAEESLAGIATVKAFGLETGRMGKFDGEMAGVYAKGKKLAVFSSVIQFVTELFLYVGVLFVACFGAVFILHGSLKAGLLVSFVLYLMIVVHAIGGITTRLMEFFRGVGAAVRFMSHVNSDADTLTTLSIPASASDGSASGSLSPYAVEFRNVLFGYPTKRTGASVLDGLSFALERNRIHFIVAPSGSGKSTIFALLERMYDCLSGDILVDGTSIMTMRTDLLRANLAVVQQDSVLMQGSIISNIQTGNANATVEDVVEATKQANAHGFIMQLPLKFDTDVGYRGQQLSGGMRQRIAIARALVRKPSVLLLDEATSALDSESEQHVMQSIRAAAATRTTIIITHKLSLIRDEDHVLVLRNGAIAEEGTHTHLLNQAGGLYAMMWVNGQQGKKEKEIQ